MENSDRKSYIEELNSRKIQEEVKLIQQEIKEKKSNRYFNITKIIFSFVGAIIIFFLIQHPERMLNKKSSEEEIRRERANMLLKLIESQHDNPAGIKLGLEVINWAYNDIASNESGVDIKTLTQKFDENADYELKIILNQELLALKKQVREEKANLRGLNQNSDEVDIINLKIKFYYSRIKQLEDMMASLRK